MNAMDRKGTFVVAHGAWTGGWSWQRVVDRLQIRGHRMLVPTLTGLCERSHLAGPAVNLDRDIVSGHDVPIDAPDELAAMLEDAIPN